jgi:hypothetical protein
MPQLTPAEALFAVFLDFYQQDLLVDVTACNLEGLVEYLNHDILSHRIKFPWIYERCLYDKFNALFPNKTDSLSSFDTELLLKDTPGGVFQLSNIVVGPFGVLTSATTRELRPILSPPLWHCSDPGCRNLHGVELESAVLPFNDAIREINRFCSQELGPASEWPEALAEFRDKGDWYDHLFPAALPWLLINGFATVELALLVGRLFDARSTELRSKLPQTRRTQALLAAPPSSIASRLDAAKLLQIILLLPDEDLVYFLEELIEDSQIVIPPAEVRETLFCASQPGWFGVTAQCSDLGVRFFSSDPSFGIRHLRSVVHKVYDDPAEQKALAWKLRHKTGSTAEERLATFLYQTDLQEVVSALFFDNPTHLEGIFSALKFGRFAIPDTEEGERSLKRKLLWKLGFGTYSFPLQNERLWDRLRRLQLIVQTAGGVTEDDKGKIRSIAVNLFVSLEEVLDSSLSFFTWALLADHFIDTKFTFNLEGARRFMADRLNTWQSKVIYDAKGRNPLYPLIVGFDLLASLVTELLAQPASQYLRATDQFPGYADSKIEPFVTPHRVFVLDLCEGDVQRALLTLRAISDDLVRSDVASIRNRIDHQRTDFPTVKEISDMCARLSQVMSNLEDGGICPLLFVRKMQRIDRYGRGEMVFERYDGKEVALRWPPVVTKPLPSTNRAQTIVPTLRFGQVPEPVRFLYREESLIVTQWAGYPIKRRRVAAPQGVGGDSEEVVAERVAPHPASAEVPSPATESRVP